MMSLLDINNMFGHYHLNFLRWPLGGRLVFDVYDHSIGFEVHFTAEPGVYVSNGMLFENVIRLFTVRKVVMLNSKHRRLTIYDDKVA